MDFKITNNDDDSIKVEISFDVNSWAELSKMMELLDGELVV